MYKKNKLFKDILKNGEKYKSDWNKMMLVVEKIESINDPHHGFFGVYISSNSCCIQGTNLRNEVKQEPPVYFNDVVLDNKLLSTYSAVVSFIQWYSLVEQLKDLRKS
tara:strand:- start:2920 stop:3240 length:321 start_codon:yes stop_codon:yes gene_type:complete